MYCLKDLNIKFGRLNHYVWQTNYTSFHYFYLHIISLSLRRCWHSIRRGWNYNEYQHGNENETKLKIETLKFENEMQCNEIGWNGINLIWIQFNSIQFNWNENKMKMKTKRNENDCYIIIFLSMNLYHYHC